MKKPNKKTDKIAAIAAVWAVVFFSACTPNATDAPPKSGIGGTSSSTNPEQQYDCAFDDSTATNDNAAGFSTTSVVSAATREGDSESIPDGQGGYTDWYKWWKDAGVPEHIRQKIAIIEPALRPQKADVEYILFYSAGHQGVGHGFAANLTGQPHGWSPGTLLMTPPFNNAPFSSFSVQTCNASMRARMSADTNRFPLSKTYSTGFFNSEYSWVGYYNPNIETATLNYIKSLGMPDKVKGIYLSGSSMGGCLTLKIASLLQNSSADGWNKVPIIYQGADPVCPNGYTYDFQNFPSDPLLVSRVLGTMPGVMDVAANPLDPNFSGPHSYLATWMLEAENPEAFMSFFSPTYDNFFPNKDQIRIYHLNGGGKVPSGLQNVAPFAEWSRSMMRDPSLGGATTPNGNTWYQQTWVYQCHKCMGRNWHDKSMNPGTLTGGGPTMATFWQDSYTYFKMAGWPVRFNNETQPETEVSPGSGVEIGFVKSILQSDSGNTEYTGTVRVEEPAGYQRNRPVTVYVEADTAWTTPLAQATYGNVGGYPSTAATLGNHFSFTVAQSSVATKIPVLIPVGQTTATFKLYIHGANVATDPGPNAFLRLKIGANPVLGKPAAMGQSVVLKISSAQYADYVGCTNSGGAWTGSQWGNGPCFCGASYVYQSHGSQLPANYIWDPANNVCKPNVTVSFVGTGKPEVEPGAPGTGIDSDNTKSILEPVSGVVNYSFTVQAVKGPAPVCLEGKCGNCQGTNCYDSTKPFGYTAANPAGTPLVVTVSGLNYPWGANAEVASDCYLGGNPIAGSMQISLQGTATTVTATGSLSVVATATSEPAVSYGWEHVTLGINGLTGAASLAGVRQNIYVRIIDRQRFVNCNVPTNTWFTSLDSGTDNNGGTPSFDRCICTAPTFLCGNGSCSDENGICK